MKKEFLIYKGNITMTLVNKGIDIDNPVKAAKIVKTQFTYLFDGFGFYRIF